MLTSCRTINMMEWLVEELRRREKVTRIFPKSTQPGTLSERFSANITKGGLLAGEISTWPNTTGGRDKLAKLESSQKKPFNHMN